MTMRLSASSLAGTARTLVAVGTVSETFMFLTTLAAAPRRGDWVPAATGGAAVLAAGFVSGAFAAGALAAGALGAGAPAAGAAAVVVAGGVAATDGAGDSSRVAVAVATPLPDAAGSWRSVAPTGLPGR
jgi:hypothetical protein